MTKFQDDYVFIFGIIDYLYYRHNIIFFITPKDFDILYSWWEKKIPSDLIRISIDNVVKRRSSRGQPVDSFMNFSYEVKKNIGLHFDLHINQGGGSETLLTENKFERFFNNFPTGLRDMEGDFLLLMKVSEEKKGAILADIHERLINIYKDDEEMTIKTEIFMSNLPPAMQKPEIIRKFRINYLNRRFNIPDFV